MKLQVFKLSLAPGIETRVSTRGLTNDMAFHRASILGIWGAFGVEPLLDTQKRLFLQLFMEEGSLWERGRKEHLGT